MIYVCDNHSAVYPHISAHPGPVSWVHIDAHCDMRGILVDRQAERAWSWNDVPVSASTWLGLLILEGKISEVEWIHDEVGGRANDLNTVRYASDLRHFPYRRRSAPTGGGVPLRLVERDFEAWQLDRAEVVLDLDWDFFADPRKAPERRDREVEAFLDNRLQVRPERVYCAYSPFYAVPDRQRYEAFVERMSALLDMPVEVLSEPEEPPHRAARALPPMARQLARKSVLWAKKQLWNFSGLAVMMMWVSVFGCAPVPHSMSLLDELEDSRWQVRASAAELLGHRPEIDAVDALIEALDDESSAVRMAAALSLGRLEAKEAREPIIWRLRRENSSTAKVHALYALGAIGESTDSELVTGLLDDDARRVQRAAGRVLWRLANRGITVEVIRTGLENEDPAIRERAARLAVKLELYELSGWEDSHLDDVHGGVRAAAWKQFTRDLWPSDVAKVRTGLGDPEEEVRREALIGLKDLDAHVARAEVLALLATDPSHRVRIQAAKTLRTLDDAKGHFVPAVWHIEEVRDQVTVDGRGAGLLTRTARIQIDQAVETVETVYLFLPERFHQLESVRIDGVLVEASVDLRDGLPEVELETPPLDSGDEVVVEVTARSERVVFLEGGERVAHFAPGPFPVRVEHLQVTLDAGAGPVQFERRGLTPLQAKDIEVGAPASAALMTPTRRYRRWQDLAWIGGLATLFGIPLLVGCVGMRRRWGQSADPVILVAILSVGLFFFLTPQLLEDNLSYYAVSRSAVLNGTLDRLEDITVFNQGLAYGPDARGPQDPLTGAWVRTSAVFAGHVLNRALGTPWAPNGLSFPYLYMTAVLDFLLVLAGSLATLAFVRRRVGTQVALPAVLGALLGTNLLLYVYGWTASSFQPSFFLFAVFLYGGERTEDHRGPPVWFFAGLLMGLLATTRTLNAIFVLIPLWEWASRVWSTRGRDAAIENALVLVAFSAGLSLGVAPQVVAQVAVDHVFFADNYGVGSGRFTGLRENLYSLLVDRGDDDYRGTGLVAAMPVYLMILAGVPLWLRDRFREAMPLVCVVGAQLLVIGAYEVYWGYHTFATPYLVPATPILCLPLAHLLSAAASGGMATSVTAAGGLVLCAIRNAWCIGRHMADDLIGDWAVNLGDAEMYHQMWMLEPKWHDGVLSYSSNFGCLLREVVGGLRAGAPGPVLEALGWYGLIAVPLGLGCALWLRRPTWTPWGAIRPAVVLAVSMVLWSLCMGWVWHVASATNLDRDYHHRRWTERKREIQPKLLPKGKSYTWNFSSESPLESIRLVTFLTGAVEEQANTQVGMVVVSVDGKRHRIPLVAGVDTADFAVDRPESSEIRGHTAPLDRAAWSYRVSDGSSHFYTAHAYVRTIALPAGTRRGRVQVRSNVAVGHLALGWLQVQEEPATVRSGRPRWLAERW